jgi:hypothetical protein
MISNNMIRVAADTHQAELRRMARGQRHGVERSGGRRSLNLHALHAMSQKLRAVTNRPAAHSAVIRHVSV